MLDKERLIKAPTITAEEVAEDDYILVDSPTLGTRKYLASKLLPQPDDMSNFKDLYKITSDNKYGVIRSSYNGPRYFRRLDYDRVVIGGAFWYKWSEYTIIHALCLIGKHPEDVSLRVSGDISDITRWTDSSPLGGYTITDNGITYYLSSLGDLFHTGVGAQLLPETSVEYIKKSENNPVFDTYIEGAMALLQLAKQ